MAAPLFDAAAFGRAYAALLPPGPIWPRDGECLQPQILAALSPPYARNTERAAELLQDAFPAGPVELLPEWEQTLGLPDPCAGESPTIEQRQVQVLARFVDAGGCSKPYLIAYAATLGVAITITEFAPSRFGRPFGLPFGGQDWAHTWRVVSEASNYAGFSFGRGYFGEPFATWGSPVLECELRRLAPAHTILLFSYVGTGVAAAWNTGAWGRDGWAA